MNRLSVSNFDDHECTEESISDIRQLSRFRGQETSMRPIRSSWEAH